MYRRVFVARLWPSIVPKSSLRLNSPIKPFQVFNIAIRTMTTSSVKSLAFPDLCEKVKTMLPEDLKADAWYIVMATGLVSCQKPHEMGSLWELLTQNSTAEEKDRISKRIRDVMMKAWTLIGIPAVVVAITSLAKAQGDVEKAATESTFSEHWKDLDFAPNGALDKRGTARIQEIYKGNISPIFSSMGSHRADMEFIEKSIIYGLFLSDLTILNSVEAGLVDVAAILCSGYRAPAIWHLRATRRLGVAEPDVDKIEDATKMIAEWCGMDKGVIDSWPTCKDIVDEI